MSGSLDVERLSDERLAKARRVANLPLPPLEPTDEAFLDECLRMLTVLPRRRDDALSGKLRVSAFGLVLRDWPKVAIEYLVTEALKTCKFHPSTAECHEILTGWKRNDRAVRSRARAALAAQRELQLRFDETMTALAGRELTQDQVDELSDGTKRIALERGYLRLHDGQFLIRVEGERSPDEQSPVYTRPAPSCVQCQDVGRILTLEGVDVDCPTCARVHEVAA